MMGCGFGNGKLDAIPVYILAVGLLALGSLTVKEMLYALAKRLG